LSDPPYANGDDNHRQDSAQSQEDEQELPVLLTDLGEILPTLLRNQAPRSPGHRRKAGDNLVTLQIPGANPSDLAVHYPLYNRLSGDVLANTIRISVEDCAAVAINNVDILAVGDLEFGKDGHIEIARPCLSATLDQKHAYEGARDISFGPDHGHKEDDHVTAADLFDVRPNWLALEDRGFECVQL
jgi:hypothetical protein